MPAGDRVVTITVTDDSGDTPTQTSTVFERTIEVDSAPTVDTNTGTTVDEGGSTTITAAMLSSSDVEDPDAADITYTLTAPPPAGTLKLDGVALDTGDTFTQQDIDDGLVTYEHGGSEGASDSFGFSVKDTNGLTVSGQSFALTVTAVNDAPELTAPASIDVTEDTETPLTGISITDADAASGTVTMTFTVGEGALAATGTADITVGGTASALTLTGTVSDINAFISGGALTFTPDANANGDVTLSIDVDDSGNSGSGGAKTDTATVTLAVTAVNDAPDLTAPASIAVTEDTATSLTGISISDIDAGSGVVTVTFAVGSGSLSATSGSGVTVGGTATSRTLSGTVTAINAFIAANGVSFTPAANATADVTLTVTVNDGGNAGTGGALTDSATVTLDITAVNDAPDLTAPASIAVTEDTATSLTGISISDIDAGSGIVTVTFAVGSGSLSATSGSGVTVGGTATSRTLSGTVTAINAFIAANGVSFTPAANATADVTLTVTVNDGGNAGTGGALTDSATVTLDITAVNDAPDLTAPASIAVTEDTATSLTGISISDIDAGSGIVTVTFAVGSGSLSATSGSGVTVGGTATSRTLSGTVTAINAFIAANGVSFTPATNATADVTLTVTVNDGGNSGTGGALTDSATVTLDITAVNDAPDLTAPASIAVTEDTATSLTGISISDIDAGSGVVTVTFAVGSGSLSATSGSGVTVGGTATSRTLSGTVTAINAFIAANGVSFTPATNATADVTLTVTVNDGGNSGTGGALTDSATVTLDITAVNDAPDLTAPASIAVTEDTATSLTGISISDIDAGSGVVTVTFAVGSGTVSATSGSGVTVGGTATSRTLSGTVTAINAFIAANGVSFTPATNATADVTLTVTVNDGGNTGTGGALTDSATVTLDITAVNDAPDLTAPVSIAVTEDTATSLTGISISDIDAGSGIVTVTFAVGSGSLSATSGSGVTVGGTATSRTLSGTVTDINAFIAANGVSFTPAANATADVTLTVTVNDGGNSGTGGALTDSATITLDITAVNDAPDLTAPASIAVTEDTATSLTGISISDVDAGSGIVTVTFAVGSGSLSATSGSGVTVGGTATSRTLSGTVTDINAFIAANGVSFTPAANATADVTLTVTVNDGGNSGTGGALTDSATVTLDITAVNDAPGQPSLAGNVVAENAAGAVIGTVTGTDPDVGDTLTFTVDDDRFEIVGGSLKLKDGVALDYESEPSVDLVITATDGGGLTNTRAVTITVTDVNEAPATPTWSGVPVAENDAGAVIGTVTGTDPDAGDTLTFTVDDTRFEIVDGTLKLKDGVALDYETEPSIDLEITATDRGGMASRRVETIIVNNVNEAPATPVWSGSTVAENDAGAVLGTVTGTDPDAGDTLTFTVDDDRFEVVDGSLKLKDGVALDYETEPSVALVITATDSDGLTNSANITVTVVDDGIVAPTPVLSGGIVAENAAGAVIGTLPDNDGGSYAIDDDRFEIIDVAGVSTLKLKDGVSLDREVAAEITLRLTATGADGGTAAADVLVRVTNVNEAPSAPVLTGTTVTENAAGAVIGTIATSDPDVGDSLTITVDDDRFEVAGGVLKLKDGVALDHEAAATVDLVITVTDAGGLTASDAVTITVGDVNEAPTAPVLTGNTVAENAPGATVGTVTTSDPDAADSVTLTVDDARFEIVSGVLKLRAGIALDHEAASDITLVLTATDLAGLATTSLVTIAVGDVNEAPAAPVLSAQTVAENLPGASIGSVDITDPDAGDTVTLTVDDARFEIVDGVLKLRDGVSLDFETEASVDLVITATDVGGLSNTAAYTITVVDDGVTPVVPVLSSSTVAENAAGAVVGTLPDPPVAAIRSMMRALKSSETVASRR
ncbi:cadherin-like domain-containing protein [Tistrella bauzanensis]